MVGGGECFVTLWSLSLYRLAGNVGICAAFGRDFTRRRSAIRSNRRFNRREPTPASRRGVSPTRRSGDGPTPTRTRTLAALRRYNGRGKPRFDKRRGSTRLWLADWLAGRCNRQLAALSYREKAVIRNHGHDVGLNGFGQRCPRRQHGGKVRIG